MSNNKNKTAQEPIKWDAKPVAYEVRSKTSGDLIGYEEADQVTEDYYKDYSLTPLYAHPAAPIE